MTDKVLERMTAPGAKKILACDGAGILGPMGVEILAELEADPRARRGKPDLVTFYREAGAQMFVKANLLRHLTAGGLS